MTTTYARAVITRALAIAIVFILGILYARATEDNPILMTLACRGTVTVSMTATEEAKPEPISMGIIVRKTTVHGFDDSQPIFGKKREPAKIIGVTETTISFGEHPIWDGGTIDRVTGDVSATFRAGSVAFPSTTYDLECQPARRMF